MKTLENVKNNGYLVGINGGYLQKEEGIGKFLSSNRVSNLSLWQGDALPLSHFRTFTSIPNLHNPFYNNSYKKLETCFCVNLKSISVNYIGLVSIIYKLSKKLVGFLAGIK